MATPTLTASVLRIPADRLAEITSLLASDEIPDPVQASIDEAVGTVDQYTAKYDLEDSHYARLVRALVMFDLYSTGSLGVMSESIKTAYEAAMKELREIRDGKFPDLAIEDPAPDSVGTTGGGSYGGAPVIGMRTDTQEDA